ncbi:MAG: hypothetical protein ABUK20_01215, partial [Anaerolineales bacterium]
MRYTNASWANIRLLSPLRLVIRINIAAGSKIATGAALTLDDAAKPSAIPNPRDKENNGFLKNE